jgi:gliding motility-associated-like protein
MKLKQILLFTLAVFIGELAFGQDCTELGQNPGTAFPVCGTSVFTHTQVKLCGNREVPSPCNNPLITDKNPYWYKFTCFTGGTLGFLITPANLADDYDWQLFDITGESPSKVYTKSSLFVACNWSGEVGKTGASDAGTSLTVCEGQGRPLFSAMPTLIQGHEYLLLISHFTESQSGYTLSFGGGTADITDPKVPAMDAAYATCSGNEIRIKLNKQMKCASIAPNGSDFEIASGAALVTNAVSIACSEAFTTDTLVLTLDRALPAGDHVLNVKVGSDGNSLLDNCENNMPDGSIGFTVHQNVSAAFSYRVKEGCTRDTVEYFHDGANNANVWTWEFDEATSNAQNATMVYSSGGEKNVTLTVSNAWCTDIYSQVVSLTPKINAAFTSPEITCSVDNVILTDNSTGNISSWIWDLGNGTTSSLKDPVPFKYTANGPEKVYTIRLAISNGSGCSDTASAFITVVGNCNIAVPSAFTPNNDGRNDFLYPTNAFNANNLIFRVYNRFGQVIFETKDWQRKWDGNVNGQPQNTGTYVWTLSYTLRATGRQYFFKGTTMLIR